MHDRGTEAAWQAGLVREWADHRYAGLFAENFNSRSFLNTCQGRSDGMRPIQDEGDDVDMLSAKGFDCQQGMIDSAQP